MTTELDSARTLIADIIEQNVVDAADASEKLVKFEKGRAKIIAEGLVALHTAVEKIQVIDRDLLKVSMSAQVQTAMNWAEDLLKDG